MRLMDSNEIERENLSAEKMRYNGQVAVRGTQTTKELELEAGGMKMLCFALDVRNVTRFDKEKEDFAIFVLLII